MPRCLYFLGHANDYPPLDEALLLKLKMLSLASMSERNKVFPYDTLRRALDIGSDDLLEHIVIQSIYAGLIHVRAAEAAMVELQALQQGCLPQYR